MVNVDGGSGDMGHSPDSEHVTFATWSSMELLASCLDEPLTEVHLDIHVSNTMNNEMWYYKCGTGRR